MIRSTNMAVFEPAAPHQYILPAAIIASLIICPSHDSGFGGILYFPILRKFPH
jgi:hypothetical protein